MEGNYKKCYEYVSNEKDSPVLIRSCCSVFLNEDSVEVFERKQDSLMLESQKTKYFSRPESVSWKGDTLYVSSIFFGGFTLERGISKNVKDTLHLSFVTDSKADSCACVLPKRIEYFLIGVKQKPNVVFDYPN